MPDNSVRSGEFVACQKESISSLLRSTCLRNSLFRGRLRACSSQPMSPMFPASRMRICSLRVISCFAMKLRTSFVHPHRTPVEQHSIQRSDSGLSFRRLRHLDKSDTAGLASIPVDDDRDGFDGSLCCKNFSQLLLCYRDIKVPDKKVGHGFIPITDIPDVFLEANFSKGDLERSPFRKASVLSQRGCTFSACRPLGPFVTSNCTVWPS